MYTNINDLINFIENQRRGEKKVNLNYMYKLCELFDNPQTKTKFIHIGGTNGKGSTISFTKAILMEAGYNVGTFISPYVVEFNERITYNDNYISNDDLLKYGNFIINKFSQIKEQNLRTPSFFEIMTLLAFLYFADLQEIDFAIIEVGIGGLLDSTNVITPLVSAVSSVSYDHTNILGHSLREIYINKLGIMKENVPFVIHNNRRFSHLIKKQAKKSCAQLHLINHKDIKNIELTLDKTQFDYKNYLKLELNLLGPHQVNNAVLAINILETRKDYFKINDEAIYRGLKKTFWPGRLEVISREPLIILDGAHNYGAIQSLSKFIRKVKKNKYIRLIFAVSSNKEKVKMIHYIEKEVDEIIFTHFSYKRSDESSNLYKVSKHKNKFIIDDLNEILKICNDNKNEINLFCGSLYFVSEIRKLIKKD